MNESQIRELIRDEIDKYIKNLIAKLFGIVTQEKNRYLSTSKAYKQLGYPSAKALRDAVQQGLFRIGKEVIDKRKPLGIRPDYAFDIEACKQRLKTNPAKRAA